MGLRNWVSLGALALVLASGPATYAAPDGAADDAAKAWAYRQVTHNPGSRSEYQVGHLLGKDQEQPGALGRVVTPAGEFSYVTGATGSWAPRGSPGWQRQSELEPGVASRTTAQATDGSLALSAPELARGWYFGTFAARRPGTPPEWGCSVTCKLWFAPASPEKLGPLLRAMRELKELVMAVEQYKGRAGNYPGELKLLPPPAAGDDPFAPVAAGPTLIDPWGTAYDLEVFDRTEARARGMSFKITSAGEDRAPGTADDLSAPEPVTPRRPRFEPRDLRDDDVDPKGPLKQGSTAETK